MCTYLALSSYVQIYFLLIITHKFSSLFSASAAAIFSSEQAILLAELPKLSVEVAMRVNVSAILSKRRFSLGIERLRTVAILYPAATISSPIFDMLAIYSSTLDIY